MTEVLGFRLGNEKLWLFPENGDPSRGGAIIGGAKPAGLGIAAATAVVWKGAEFDDSKSSWTFVLGTNRSSRTLELVEQNSGNDDENTDAAEELSAADEGSVQKSEPRLGRLDLRVSRIDCRERRFWVLDRLSLSRTGDPRLRRVPSV